MQIILLSLTVISVITTTWFVHIVIVKDYSPTAYRFRVSAIASRLETHVYFVYFIIRLNLLQNSSDILFRRLDAARSQFLTFFNVTI